MYNAITSPMIEYLESLGFTYKFNVVDGICYNAPDSDGSNFICVYDQGTWITYCGYEPQHHRYTSYEAFKEEFSTSVFRNIVRSFKIDQLIL